MKKLMQVRNWRPAYVALRNIGITDTDIAKLAGVTRATVNSVICGRIEATHHQIGFNGGVRMLNKLKELKTNGLLPDFTFDDIRTGTPSEERPPSDEPGEGLGEPSGGGD